MTNVNVYLRENIGSISSNISVAPRIDEKKLNNAVQAFSFTGSPSTVVALFDNTLFGSGKDGILFTGEQLIYRSGSFTDPVSVPFVDIATVEYVETVSGSKGDKVDVSLLISRKEGADMTITGLSSCNYRKLVETLQTCVQDFSEFKEERQLVSINELGEPLKVAYVQAVINSAYANDQVIDDKEFAEVLQLMTRLDLSPSARFILRAYMTSSSAQISLATLLERIHSNSPAGQIKALHVSLVKDLINLYYSTDGRDIALFAFLQYNRELLQVSDEEIELAVMAIKNDYDIRESWLGGFTTSKLKRQDTRAQSRKHTRAL